MTTRNIDTLRDHLFDQLDRLKADRSPEEIERARAVRDVAQVMVNSAMAEVKFLQLTGSNESGFLGDGKTAAQGKLPPGVLGIKQHRIGG